MRCAVVGSTVLLALCPLAADEVLLKNGDRLTGRIEKLTDRTLTFQSDVAGEVEIDLEAIETLASDEPVEIHLEDGTILHRRIVPAQEGRFAIEEDELLEAQTFALGNVAAMNPPVEAVRWRGDFSLGLVVARGNTESENVNVELDLVRRSDRDRISFDAGYFFGRQRDPDTGERTTTADNWTAAGKYDYFLTERLYLYANTRVQRDRIAELDLRLAPGVGVGYQWIETEAFEFFTEAGLSWIYESFRDDTATRRTMAGRLAYDLQWRLNDRVRLFHDLEYLPSLEDFGDFLISTEAGIRSSLTDAMFSEFKVVFDYDSTPAEAAGRRDVRYVASVGWSF